MTRGGTTPILPDETAGATGASGDCTPGLGTTAVIGLSSSTGAGDTPRAIAGCVGLLIGKSGFVLALDGAPVMGGAGGFVGACSMGEADEGCLGGSCGMLPEGGRERFDIGLVTAVDQAGAFGPVPWPEGLIGRVVAAEIFGRGVILVEAGLRGRGGRLIRKVSR